MNMFFGFILVKCNKSKFKCYKHQGYSLSGTFNYEQLKYNTVICPSFYYVLLSHNWD